MSLMPCGSGYHLICTTTMPKKRKKKGNRVVMKVKPISVGDRVQTELSRVQLTVRYVTVIGGSIDIDNKIKNRQMTLVRIIEVT